MHKDALLPFSINMSILKKLTLESKLLPSCETIKPNARSSLPKRDGTGHRFQGLGRISDKGKLDLLPHGVSPSALFRFQEHSTLLPPARQMPATWRILSASLRAKARLLIACALYQACKVTAKTGHGKSDKGGPWAPPAVRSVRPSAPGTAGIRGR